MVMRFDGDVQLHVDEFDGPGTGDQKQLLLIGFEYQDGDARIGRALLLTRRQAAHLAQIILDRAGIAVIGDHGAGVEPAPDSGKKPRG